MIPLFTEKASGKFLPPRTMANLGQDRGIAGGFVALVALLTGCSGDGGSSPAIETVPTDSPTSTPYPTPSLAPGFYFANSDGSYTNLAPYTLASPFPVSVSKYPNATIVVTNLDPAAIGGPGFNSGCYRPGVLTANSFALSLTTSGQCNPDEEQDFSLGSGSVHDSVYIVSAK